MDKEIYLIHLNAYMGHIDDKLEMYNLLLELVRSLRHDLEAVEDAQALRTVCCYEQKAHEMYENWDIPDNYLESGSLDCLAQLMEDELLPAYDGDGNVENDGIMDDDRMDSEGSAAIRLLRAVGQLTESTRSVLAVAKEIAAFEEEADRLGDGEENACAE